MPLALEGMARFLPMMARFLPRIANWARAMAGNIGERIAGAIYKGGSWINRGIRSFGRSADDIARLPQDVNVNPRAPRALPTDRSIGRSPSQNRALQEQIADWRRKGYTDIRVNQHQVNARGERVGINRPDLQGTNPQGRREYVEYETSKSTRGPGHERRIRANDPHGTVDVIKAD